MLIGLAYAGFYLFKVLPFLISRISYLNLRGVRLNAKHRDGNHYISIYTLCSDYCHDINNPKRAKKSKKITSCFKSINPIHR
jgi:hypothetical protein